MIKAAWFIFFSELVLHLRRSQEWLYPLGFFIIVMCFFPLVFTSEMVSLQKLLPGCVWISALFASLLSIENLFLTDTEDGNLEQLLICQIPLPWIISAKLCAHWIVTELPLILLTAFFAVLFHLNTSTLSLLCLSLLLGTPIFTLIGALGVALTLGLRQQGALLGVIILPLVAPVLILGVNIVQQVQAGFAIQGACLFLAGICVLAMTAMPWVIAAVLRISLDE